MGTAKRPERRKGADPVTKAISYFSGASWILILAVLGFISSAQPKQSTMFDRGASMTSGRSLDKSMMGWAAILLVVTALVCFFGLAMNSMRHRRRSDFYNKSLVFFGVGSVVGIIMYFIIV